MLRFYRSFARVYVNNIVIFNKTLNKHVEYIYTIFDLLNNKKVILSTKKIYLEYSIVILLDQKIDVFDLIAIANKIVAIKTFDFSYKLENLKLYLELIKQLREQISYYAQKTKILQCRKIILLRLFSSNKNGVRKIYS